MRCNRPIVRCFVRECSVCCCGDCDALSLVWFGCSGLGGMHSGSASRVCSGGMVVTILFVSHDPKGDSMEVMLTKHPAL